MKIGVLYFCGSDKPAESVAKALDKEVASGRDPRWLVAGSGFLRALANDIYRSPSPVPDFMKYDLELAAMLREWDDNQRRIRDSVASGDGLTTLFDRVRAHKDDTLYFMSFRLLEDTP